MSLANVATRLAPSPLEGLPGRSVTGHLSTETSRSWSNRGPSPPAMSAEAGGQARKAANDRESAQRGETHDLLVDHQVLEVHGGFARAAHGAPSARCTDCQGLPLRASECSALPTTATLSALGIPCGRFQHAGSARSTRCTPSRSLVRCIPEMMVRDALSGREPREMIMPGVPAVTPFVAAATEAAALCRRAREDGFVYLPRLLPADRLSRLRSVVDTALTARGWVVNGRTDPALRLGGWDDERRVAFLR